MDIRELKYFTQVAISANYSAAAEKLYISQPALSKVIQKMERELGTKLFYTEHRQQCLTPEGQQLYEKASKVIAEYDEISEAVHTDKGFCSGHVHIGFPDVAGTCFFCELIANFSHQYPNIKLHIREDGSQRILSDVESGALDVGCVVLPVPEDSFDASLFGRDSSCLVVSKDHPLARRDSVSLKELRDESFILLGAEFSTHYDIKTALQQAGFEPNIVMLSSQWDFVIQMVRLNYGIAFLPRSLFQRFYYPDIHLLEIDGGFQVEELGLVTKHGQYLPRSVKCFIDYALTHFTTCRGLSSPEELGPEI